MIEPTAQSLNGTLPSATGSTYRHYGHTALQNVVFLWTTQRTERIQWKGTGSQYWQQIKGEDNAPI